MKILFDLILMTFAVLCFPTHRVFGTPSLGQALPRLQLAGDQGGLTNGEKWTSEMIKDHIWLLFYVDPDHKDDNPELEKALSKEQFPEDRFGSIAIINMAATWLPDAILKPSLESKQRDYPRVTYVLDRKKNLVERWNLTDNTYNVLILDKEARVLFAKAGPLQAKEIAEVIRVIHQSLALPTATDGVHSPQ